MTQTPTFGQVWLLATPIAIIGLWLIWRLW